MFLSALLFILGFAAIVVATYAHMRIFNRPYLGKEHTAQPDTITSKTPAIVYTKHLESRHWWELWMGSCFVRFFCNDNPEPKERKTFAHLYLPKESSSKPFPLIFYTHGNGATVEESAAWLEHLIDAGFALLICEYRGFGLAGGHPHRKLIHEDLCFFYDEVIKEPLINKDQITFYGRSLGGGVACDLIHSRNAHSLILESTYKTIVDVSGAKQLPDYIFYGKDFECASAVESFNGNLLLIHGKNDTVCELKQSQDLHALNPQSELIVLDADHSNIFQQDLYKRTVLNWLLSKKV